MCLPWCRTFLEAVDKYIVIGTVFRQTRPAIQPLNRGAESCRCARARQYFEYRRAHRYAKRIQAGTVWINCGGYKQSGWGYERGWKGIEAYLNIKAVHVGL